MLDINRINKVKRVLSAGDGTQLPNPNKRKFYKDESTGKFFIDDKEVTEQEYNSLQSELGENNNEEIEKRVESAGKALLGKSDEATYEKPTTAALDNQKQKIVDAQAKNVMNSSQNTDPVPTDVKLVNHDSDNKVVAQTPPNPNSVYTSATVSTGYTGQLPQVDNKPEEKEGANTETVSDNVVPEEILNKQGSSPGVDVTKAEKPINENEPYVLPEVDVVAQRPNTNNKLVGAPDLSDLKKESIKNQNELNKKPNFFSKAKESFTKGFSDAKDAWNNLSLEDKGAAVGEAGNYLGMMDKMLYSGQSANDSERTRNLDSAYGSLADGISQAGPYGAMIGGAMKGLSFVNNTLQEFTGAGTDQMTGTDQFFDSAFGMLTGVGWINGIGGKRSDSFSVDDTTIREIGGSYGGTVDTLNDAQSKAGKKYGLFSSGARKKANEAIREAKYQQGKLQSINAEAQDRKNLADSMSDINHMAYSYNLAGGYDQRYNRAAKSGMKFEEIWEPEIEEEFIVNIIDINDVQQFKSGGEIKNKIDLDEWSPVVEEFKEGGKVDDNEIEVIDTNTNQKSVIPDGSLHKNKHHMDNAEGLTKKGVPVVDNNGEQQAEIELNEIIFTLEVTKELESRYKEYYQEGTSNKRKDELVLEAGKLLWHEIIYNTEDRTGLIDTLKKGGTIPNVVKTVSEFKSGGQLNQSTIDEMVKQALLNILTK